MNIKSCCTITKNFYSVELCNKYPKHLFVFGDNTLRVGKGGQAQIRDCRNAIGIATKKSPGMKETDFFDDKELVINQKIILEDIEKIIQKFNGGDFNGIVFPGNGLGTGLAELPKRAPKTNQILLNALYVKFGLNGENYINKS